MEARIFRRVAGLCNATILYSFFSTMSQWKGLHIPSRHV